MGLADATRRFRLLPANQSLGWTPYAWLVYLATFLVDPFVHGAGAGTWTLTVVASLAFLASYFRGYWERGRRLLPIIAFQVALGLAFSAINSGAAVFFVYAASFAGQLDRQRDAVRLILLITVIALLSAWAFDGLPYAWITAVVFTPLIGGVNLHFSQAGRANFRLRLAQQEIEHLATVAERERIARDLHDVLGHTLSLIILKSELASKIAERDPARAGSEMRDVERVARAALAEVRETIRGYRATFDDEIERARTLLDAAGIAGEFTVHLPDADEKRDEVLALVLRETVTNVARHSLARVCRVVIEGGRETCLLDVSDDGRGGPVIEGSGIRGMRERLEALGGTLVLDGSRGMHLTATIPVGSAAERRPVVLKLAGQGRG
jgi:two-component system, NarL family, sensor histidine kinase DesK